MLDPGFPQREGVMRVGEILVAMGLVTAGDVAAAVAYQRTHGVKLGAALVALDLLSVDAIVSALEDQRDFEIRPASNGGIVFNFPPKPAGERRLPAVAL
jgi:hypothetical protein